MAKVRQEWGREQGHLSKNIGDKNHRRPLPNRVVFEKKNETDILPFWTILRNALSLATTHMKYLFVTAFAICIACNGPKEKPACTEKQAIDAVRKIPEVVRQAHYLDSLSHHRKGMSFMTDSVNIDGKDYFQISAGFDGEFHRESYFTFLVDKQNCVDIMVDDILAEKMLTLAEWQQQQKVDAPISKRKVKLPFLFHEYYDACVDPGDKAKCNADYPAYPLDDNLKVFADEDATEYFILPELDTVKPYIITYTQTDVERYFLITVVNHKLVGKLQIGQADDNDLLYFVVDKKEFVHLYSGKNKPQGTYQIATDGSIIKSTNNE